MSNNALSLNLSIQQDEDGSRLSDAALQLTYPAINRDAANLVQYTTIGHVLLSNVRLAVAQAGQNAPEMLPMYAEWLAEMADQFSALAGKATPPAETVQAPEPTLSPGIMR